MRDANREQNAPLGARLRRLREAAGLTQEELADRVGLTASQGRERLGRGERRRLYPTVGPSLEGPAYGCFWGIGCYTYRWPGRRSSLENVC
jgi:hypothetical protein